MREIKFRAIHKLTKKAWNEEELVFHNGKWYEDWLAFEDGMSLNMNQCEVMQYTGLKDKNGVDIYEGDVLTLKYPRDRRYTVTAKVIRGTQISAMVLKFEDGFTTEEIPLYKISAEHNLEVIGNIYENPELLECESE